MIEAEQLHARILARLDMTRDMEDEELTELIYEVLPGSLTGRISAA